MLRKTLLAVMILGIAMVGLAGQGFCSPYLVPGPINFYADVTPTFDTDITGRALYRFTTLPASPNGFNFIRLTFEDDIFDLAATAQSLTSNNATWSAQLDTSLGTYSYVEFWSTDEVVSDNLNYVSFTSDFTLLSADRDDFISDPNNSPSQWEWDDSDIWSQSVTVALFSSNPGEMLGFGGGSVFLTPEPASLSLLGLGLLGLLGIRRKRKKL